MKYRAWNYEEIPIGAILTKPPFRVQFAIVGKKETGRGTYLITPPDNDACTLFDVEFALEYFRYFDGNKWRKCGVKL